ncbi:formylglycine-generating enzyme family protein, partial [Candidatus Latescibacterota bacterium]
MSDPCSVDGELNGKDSKQDERLPGPIPGSAGARRPVPALLAAVAVTLMAVSLVAADEGYWTHLSAAGGAHYSPVDHPDIALEKEVLIYHGRRPGERDTEAHFLFRNTSQRAVTVQVGFPVKVTVPREETYEYDPSRLFLRRVSLAVPTRSYVPYSQFDQINWIGGWSNILKSLAILQDGQAVTIDSVLVEMETVPGVSTGADEAPPDTAMAQYHLLHSLTFPPHAYSRVVVAYSVHSVTAGGGMSDRSHINWIYILGTGNTWKGPIGTLYFLVPEHLEPTIPDPFRHVGLYQGYRAYVAREYEPLSSDEVSVSYSRYDHGDIWSGGLDTMAVPTAPAQGHVVVRGASSHLGQRTWINSTYTGVRPPGPGSGSSAGVIDGLGVTVEGIGFGPLSLVDGYLESAWCEGVEGDGLDEWVELELTEDVHGLSVTNGFAKVPQGGSRGVPWTPYYVHYDDEARAEALDRTYANNGRPRQLELVAQDGTRQFSIELQDTTGLQEFPDLSLPKGVYRLYIKSAYPGAKWHDTCLGEMEFHAATARDVVEGDEFLAGVLAGEGAADLPEVKESPGSGGEEPPASEEDIPEPVERSFSLPSGVPMDFVWIEPGTFTMGTTPERMVVKPKQHLYVGSYMYEAPAHQVTITRGFWLGKYEITQEQWEGVVGTTP